jgi:hypothetical protein
MYLFKCPILGLLFEKLVRYNNTDCLPWSEFPWQCLFILSFIVLFILTATYKHGRKHYWLSPMTRVSLTTFVWWYLIFHCIDNENEINFISHQNEVKYKSHVLDRHGQCWINILTYDVQYKTLLLIKQQKWLSEFCVKIDRVASKN